MLKLKRVYIEPDKNDGFRVLVDRLWPRGLIKEKAKIDIWLKDIAPSGALRKWFAHKEELWSEFRERYFKELRSKEGLIEELKTLSRDKTVTLLYAAKDEAKNNASALLEFLKRK